MNQNTKINRLNQRQYDRPKNMDIDLLNEETDYQDQKYTIIMKLIIIIIVYFITMEPFKM